MFSNLSQLPIITYAENRAMRMEGKTLPLLYRLKCDLVEGIDSILPETLLALARQHAPNEADDYKAVLLLGVKIADDFSDLARHGEETNALYKAERERLKPVTDKAVQRNNEIYRQLELINVDVSNHEVRSKARAVKLREAELEEADIAHETAKDLARRDELLAARAELQSESDALDQFLRTGDESCLPANFVRPDAV